MSKYGEIEIKTKGGGTLKLWGPNANAEMMRELLGHCEVLEFTARSLSQNRDPESWAGCIVSEVTVYKQLHTCTLQIKLRGGHDSLREFRALLPNVKFGSEDAKPNHREIATRISDATGRSYPIVGEQPIVGQMGRLFSQIRVAELHRSPRSNEDVY